MALHVVHNGQELSLSFVSTEGKGLTLLGRNWLEALWLDWRTTIGSSRTLQQVLDNYTEVFKDELGELQGLAAKIYVEGGVHPRFEKAPFAIREKVEQEHEQLQAPGVIQVIGFSDSAAPIVPVTAEYGFVGTIKLSSTKLQSWRSTPSPELKKCLLHLQ